MTRSFARGAMVLALVAATGAAVGADVKTREKSHVKFEGMLGRMVGLFGGKAAREGVVNSVSLHGERKATFNEQTGEVIDLGEQKVYLLDMKKKTYTVKTFAELRKEMEEARREAEKNAREAQQRSKDQEAREDGREMEVDFDVKDTGQRRTVNGHDARQVVMTVTVREKGKTLDQSGGIVMSADSWLAPGIDAMKEVAAFDRRFAEQVYGSLVADPRQMAAALAMYPGLQDAIAKFNAEKVNLDGTPVQTTVTFEAVQSTEQMAQAEEEKKESGGGGIGGLLARKVMRKKEEPNQQPGRATIMTMTHELLQVTPSAAPADVEIPAGFKQR